MTSQELDAIERLLKAATPGPWKTDGSAFIGTVPGGRPRGEVIGEARLYNHTVADKLPRDFNTANAAAIVALVNNAPALLAAAREREALREGLKRIGKVGHLPSGVYELIDRLLSSRLDAVSERKEENGG